jgi:hypothetical protein
LQAFLICGAEDFLLMKMSGRQTVIFGQAQEMAVDGKLKPK